MTPIEQAAHELREQAKYIFECHTVDGVMLGDDDARAEHDRLIALAEQLEAIGRHEPVAVTNEIAFAFHHALTDGALSESDAEEIKAGLRAALAWVCVASQPAPDVAAMQARIAELENERDDWIACHAKVFRELQGAKQIVGNQAERIAELERGQGVLVGTFKEVDRLAELAGFNIGGPLKHTNAISNPAVITERLTDADRYLRSISEVSSAALAALAAVKHATHASREAIRDLLQKEQK